VQIVHVINRKRLFTMIIKSISCTSPASFFSLFFQQKSRYTNSDISAYTQKNSRTMISLRWHYPNQVMDPSSFLLSFSACLTSSPVVSNRLSSY